MALSSEAVPEVLTPMALQVIETMAIRGGVSKGWSVMIHAGIVKKGQKVRVPHFT